MSGSTTPAPATSSSNDPTAWVKAHPKAAAGAAVAAVAALALVTTRGGSSSSSAGTPIDSAGTYDTSATDTADQLDGMQNQVDGLAGQVSDLADQLGAGVPTGKAPTPRPTKPPKSHPVHAPHPGGKAGGRHPAPHPHPGKGKPRPRPGKPPKKETPVKKGAGATVQHHAKNAHAAIKKAAAPRRQPAASYHAAPTPRRRKGHRG